MLFRGWRPVWIGGLVAISAREPDLRSVFQENPEVSEECASTGLAHALGQGDGVLAEREARLLGSLSRATGQPALEESADGVAGTFHTERPGASAVVELMGAGHVDSEYHAVGSESVAETARVQGCTDVELISLEGWVVRQVVLIRGAPGFRAVEGV